MKSHSGEAKGTESNSIANDTVQKKSTASPSKLQAMIDNSPQVQQMKAYQLMADLSQSIQQKNAAPALQMRNKAMQLKPASPVPLIVNSPMATTAMPVQFVLPMAVSRYIPEKMEFLSEGFRADHHVDPLSSFTTSFANQQGVKSKKTKNTIANIDSEGLKSELRGFIAGMEPPEYATAANEMIEKTTAASYNWITSKKPHTKPDLEGGTGTLKFGLKRRGGKKTSHELRIMHLNGDGLTNNPKWIKDKKAADQAAEDEAARIAAEEEAARIEAERIEAERLAALEEGPGEENAAPAETAEQAEKRKAKYKRKKKNRKAKKGGGGAGDDEGGDDEAGEE